MQSQPRTPISAALAAASLSDPKSQKPHHLRKSDVYQTNGAALSQEAIYKAKLKNGVFVSPATPTVGIPTSHSHSKGSIGSAYRATGAPLSEEATYKSKLKYGQFKSPAAPSVGVASNSSGAAAELATSSNLSVNIWKPEVNVDGKKAALATFGRSSEYSPKAWTPKESPAAANAAHAVREFVPDIKIRETISGKGTYSSNAASFAHSVPASQFAASALPEVYKFAEERNVSASDHITKSVSAKVYKDSDSIYASVSDPREAASARTFSISQLHSLAAKNAQDRLSERDRTNFGGPSITDPQVLAEARRRADQTLLNINKNIGETSLYSNIAFNEAAIKIANQSHEERSRNSNKINLGGGAFITQEEAEAIAQKFVKPVLDEISEKAEAQRAADEVIRQQEEELRQHKLAEKEALHAQKQKEKEERQAEKNEQKKIDNERKEELRSKKAEEKRILNEEKSKHIADLEEIKEKDRLALLEEERKQKQIYDEKLAREKEIRDHLHATTKAEEERLKEIETKDKAALDVQNELLSEALATADVANKLAEAEETKAKLSEKLESLANDSVKIAKDNLELAIQAEKEASDGAELEKAREGITKAETELKIKEAEASKAEAGSKKIELDLEKTRHEAEEAKLALEIEEEKRKQLIIALKLTNEEQEEISLKDQQIDDLVFSLVGGTKELNVDKTNGQKEKNSLLRLLHTHSATSNEKETRRISNPIDPIKRQQLIEELLHTKWEDDKIKLEYILKKHKLDLESEVKSLVTLQVSYDEANNLVEEKENELSELEEKHKTLSNKEQTITPIEGEIIPPTEEEVKTSDDKLLENESETSEAAEKIETKKDSESPKIQEKDDEEVLKVESDIKNLEGGLKDAKVSYKTSLDKLTEGQTKKIKTEEYIKDIEQKLKNLEQEKNDIPELSRNFVASKQEESVASSSNGTNTSDSTNSNQRLESINSGIPSSPIASTSASTSS